VLPWSASTGSHIAVFQAETLLDILVSKKFQTTMSGLDCRAVSTCEGCRDGCVPCKQGSNDHAWTCVAKQCPTTTATLLSLSDCLALEGQGSESATKVVLVVLVVVVSLIVAVAISYSQVKMWLQNDRKMRRWMDEDERLVLHEHPEALDEVEMSIT